MLNVKKTLNKILTNLKAPIIVKTYNLPVITYAANQATWLYAKDWHAPQVSGYIPISILQATPESGGGNLCPHVLLDYASYGDRFAGEVLNTGAAATVTIILPILYIREDLYGAAPS